MRCRLFIIYIYLFHIISGIVIQFLFNFINLINSGFAVGIALCIFNNSPPISSNTFGKLQGSLFAASLKTNVHKRRPSFRGQEHSRVFWDCASWDSLKRAVSWGRLLSVEVVYGNWRSTNKVSHFWAHFASFGHASQRSQCKPSRVEFSLWNLI